MSNTSVTGAGSQMEWLGLMSGSSLDGLDVAWCTFERVNDRWSGKIGWGKTFELPANLRNTLENLRNGSALDLAKTDAEFSRFSARCINSFLENIERKPYALASHGHTIFHQPPNGFTTQIGNGGLLASLTGIPVVADFRTTDVGKGGQGAPLVPGAERFLFSEWEACLNLGGIANISFPKSSPFVGFDVCPCNQLLNTLALRTGKPYDEDGILARHGRLIPSLAQKLDALDYYQKTQPKSLGNEEVAAVWLEMLSPGFEPQDILFTLCQHIAHQVAKAILRFYTVGNLLITGGGAFNSFLIELIEKELGSSWNVKIPDSNLISFKEAYCFAFLGLKRWLGEVNCFAEITGAQSDSSCGAIYLP